MYMWSGGPHPLVGGNTLGRSTALHTPLDHPSTPPINYLLDLY